MNDVENQWTAIVRELKMKLSSGESLFYRDPSAFFLPYELYRKSDRLLYKKMRYGKKEKKVSVQEARTIFHSLASRSLKKQKTEKKGAC
jgi:hypothetical protein